MSKSIPVLSRDQILKADDLAIEQVEVPEWGGTVLVRGLTGEERDMYEQSLVEGRGKNAQMNLRNARAKLVVLCVVDEAGKPLFQRADVAVLGRKSAAALDRIFEAAKRLSGLSDSDVDELLGNSEPDPNGGFTSS